MQVLNPTTESKRAVKQLLRCLRSTENACLRLEPHVSVQEGMIAHVGRSDSDSAGELSTRQSVTTFHCHSCKPSVSVVERQSSTRLVLAQSSFGVLPNCSRNFTTKFQIDSTWTHNQHVKNYRGEDQEILSTSRFVARPFSRGSETKRSIGGTRGYETQYSGPLPVLFRGTTNASERYWRHGRLRG